jgi:hypothetical protein
MRKNKNVLSGVVSFAALLQLMNDVEVILLFGQPVLLPLHPFQLVRVELAFQLVVQSQN